MSRITVDRDRCIGSGQCVVYAPTTFALDGEAKATVVDPAGDDVAAVRTAVEACPMSALSLAEEGI